VSQAFKELYIQGGIPGLWRGAVVNVQRAALVNLGDLTTYDTTKHFLISRFNFQDNFITHTISRLDYFIFF
jgi:solute carrier family 25 uncoupling protein 27